MSLLKKLAGETAIYGMSSILSRLISYVLLTPYLTRWFVPEAYGIITLLFFYSGLLTVIYTYRMETAFFRFGSKEGQMDRTFSTASIAILSTTIVLSVSLLVFSGPISEALYLEDHREYVYWVVSIIAFDALAAIPFARLRLENRPIRFAIAKTLGILIYVGMIFFFLKLCPYLIEQGHDWASAIYQEEHRISYVFISNLLGSGIVMLILSPVYFKIRAVFDRGLFKQMIYYAAPLIIVSLAAVINQNIAYKLLEIWLPGGLEANRAAAGVFSASAKIAVLMSLFTQAFNYAAEPFFFRHVERSDSRHIYAQVGQAFAAVGSLAFLGIMLYLELIQFFIGKELRTGLSIVPILLMANLALGLYYNFAIWFKLKDQTKIGAYISIGGMAITFVVNLLLIPSIGYAGPAWATLACYVFMALASYLSGRYYYPIPYPMGRIAAYVLSALLFYGISVWIRPWLGDSLLLVLTINSLILLAYMLCFYWVERKSLLAMLGKN
ncbi:MAG: polysaccharide biosynthesis C-terminal domain-containing protein [Bacteroidota bacterium]